MRKFKDGDRVVVVNRDSGFFGERGRVTYIDGGRTQVYFDSGIEKYFRTEDLESEDIYTALSAKFASFSDQEVDSSHYDEVKNPEHYARHPSGIQPIQITRHHDFLTGNVIKYVMRAPYKGNEIQDLKKAMQYLEWAIEKAEEEARGANANP